MKPLTSFFLERHQPQGGKVPFPYVISHEKLTLYIKIVELKDLHLHEETIPEFLDRLANSIEANGCLRHPVIVDKKSLLVLDGMHRVAALEKLGCKRIPVCLVDYENPAIVVGCWYRTVRGSKVAEFLSQLKQGGIAIKRTVSANNSDLGISPVVAAIQTGKENFQILFAFQNLKEAYDIIKRIEDGIKAYDFKVGFETESDALHYLHSRKVDAVLLTPKPTKSEIINTALSGQVFSCKATRHIIPARPMYLNVPLSILQDSSRSLEEVNDWLKETLEKRHLKFVPAGSVLEGRRYEEGVYVFEE
jgi:hypothetical protein